jgi:hypothetical protein
LHQPAIGWKRYEAIGVDSTAYESMTNGAYASSGTLPGRTMSKSLITIEAGLTMNKMRPIHPGEILREEFLEPDDLSANSLAIALRVPHGLSKKTFPGTGTAATATDAVRHGGRPFCDRV